MYYKTLLCSSLVCNIFLDQLSQYELHHMLLLCCSRCKELDPVPESDFVVG
jgi:hypothetical protein